MVGILFLLAVLGLAGAAVAVPAALKRRDAAKRLRARRYVAMIIRARGTAEQKQRLEELERREIDLQLKLLEAAQVHDVLDSPDVRAKLEGANFDVEELKRVLAGPEDDPALKAFEELEQGLLLTQGKEEDK